MNCDEFARFEGVRVVALDLDGVVYKGSQVLVGAGEAVQALRELGFKVSFVTNNSGKTRADIAAKLVQMGIPATEDEILTSAYAASVLISRLSGHKPARVLVIGSDGLKSEAARREAEIVTSAPCDFLLVGLDVEFSYQKISMALDALIAGAVFIACNRDATYPVEGNRVLPGCGPIVAAIESASGRTPDYLVGKPNSILLNLLAEKDKVDPQELLVIGDGLESDIAMANRFGSPSVFVNATENLNSLTGLEACEQKPCLIVKSLAELPPLIQKARYILPNTSLTQAS